MMVVYLVMNFGTCCSLTMHSPRHVVISFCVGLLSWIDYRKLKKGKSHTCHIEKFIQCMVAQLLRVDAVIWHVMLKSSWCLQIGGNWDKSCQTVLRDCLGRALAMIHLWLMIYCTAKLNAILVSMDILLMIIALASLASWIVIHMSLSSYSWIENGYCWLWIRTSWTNSA